MFCTRCGQELVEQAVACTRCGTATAYFPQVVVQSRSRTAYILLGVLPGLFGFPGVHNLYAGHLARGLVQLLLSVMTCWLLWIPMLIWTIVEVCTVTRDGDGRPMS